MKIDNIANWENWMDSLAENDFVVIDDFLIAESLQILLSYFHQKEKESAFSKAAIGQTGDELVIKEIRGDYTYWLDKKTDIQLNTIFEILEEAKNKLNQLCYLSLSNYEFHLAHYPVGSFYKKHLDQFKNRNNRMISMIIYLNDNWQEGDGGELKVYPKGKNQQLIPPLMNRCVMFKSADLPHEVLKTNVGRKSLTGWMLYLPTPLAVIQN